MASDAPLYDFTIPVFIRGMKNMLHCMDKAEAYAKEKGEDIETYCELRIYEDMKPFKYQIQRISDTAKFTMTRLAAPSSPVHAQADSLVLADNEKSWSELRTRLTRTIAILEEHANPADFRDQETKELVLFGNMKFSGLSYVQIFAVPNFHFHLTTAYCLLRMKGVPVGKVDFLAGKDGSST